MRGVRGGPQLSPTPFPHARPDFFLAGLPGAEKPSSPGTGVSHPEEAVTERGSRRTLPGLGGAGREAAARDTRGPNAPSPGPGSPGRLRSPSLLCGASLHSCPGPPPSPWQPSLSPPKNVRSHARLRVASPRGRLFPALGVRDSLSRLRDGGGARLTRRGSRNRRARAAGGARRAGRGEPGVSARQPGRRTQRLRAVPGPPRAPPPAAPRRSRRAGEGRPGHPVTSPRERREKRQTDKRVRGRLSPLPRRPAPAAPAAATPGLTRSGGRSRW